jgi:hypothetical protein
MLHSGIRTATHTCREAESVENAIWTDTPPSGRFEALMLPLSSFTALSAMAKPTPCAGSGC